MSKELREDLSPRAEVESALQEWLRSSEWTLSELVDWLQGYAFPPFGEDEEPYLPILRALPHAGDRHPAETELSVRLARLISEKPDVRPIGDDPEQVLYNLFLLCAGLACPNQLAKPLASLLGRRKLAGTWRGVRLVSALRMALAQNQADASLYPVWKVMLRGEEGGFLVGSPVDGFYGVLQMPSVPGRAGEPALEEIGFAVAELCAFLEHQADCKAAFRYLMSLIPDTYPGRPSFERELMYLADKFRWPVWAVECLRLFYLERDPAGVGRSALTTWSPIAEFLRELADVEVLERLCQGTVVKVSFAAAMTDAFAAIASETDEMRMLNPWVGERSALNILVDALLITASRDASSRLAEHALEFTRRVELEKMQIRVPSEGDVSPKRGAKT